MYNIVAINRCFPGTFRMDTGAL